MKQETWRKNILLVDDSVSIHLLIESALSSDDYMLFHAYNGKEAIEIYKDNSQIDCVFMDLNMPELNGLESLAELKKMNAELKVIAQTADTDHLIERRIEVQKLGFSGLVLKPINRSVFLAVCSS